MKNSEQLRIEALEKRHNLVPPYVPEEPPSEGLSLFVKVVSFGLTVAALGTASALMGACL